MKNRLYTTNVDGETKGLYNSDLIREQLVSHYVPFLPLESKHVRKCAEKSLRVAIDERQAKSHKGLVLAPNFTEERINELIETILKFVEYMPRDVELFSTHGCKRVREKALIYAYD